MTKYLLFFVTTITVSLFSYGQDTSIVIFPKEKPVHAPNDSPTSRFTPTETETTEVDEIIKAYIKEKYPTETSVKYNNYYRQYYGSILMGLKTVFVNGCCTKPEKFLDELFFPKGGGNCYFRAKVNLKSKKIMSFKFNAAK